MTGLHDLVHRYPTVKGLRGREGPDVMRFDLDQVQGLLICLFEESVAGLMSEVCPFLKEMKRRERDPLRSLVRSK